MNRDDYAAHELYRRPTLRRLRASGYEQVFNLYALGVLQRAFLRAPSRRSARKYLNEALYAAITHRGAWFLPAATLRAVEWLVPVREHASACRIDFASLVAQTMQKARTEPELAEALAALHRLGGDRAVIEHLRSAA